MNVTIHKLTKNEAQRLSSPNLAGRFVYVELMAESDMHPSLRGQNKRIAALVAHPQRGVLARSFSLDELDEDE